MKKHILLYLTLSVFATFELVAQPLPQIVLTPFATGFTNPVDIANAGDSRLFVVERQDGSR